MIKEIQAFMGDYEIKKMKKFTTHRGIAWSCDVYEHGKRIGDVMDQGNGGMIEVEVADPEAAKRLEDYAKSKGFDFEGSGNFIGQCCDYLESLKKLKTSCKTKTLIISKNKREIDDQGVDMTYSIINRPFDANLKLQIMKTFPDTVVILNEEFETLSNTKTTKVKPK